jgi:phage baseplate assembly protein gpV
MGDSGKDNALENLVRVGIVSAVSGRKARVTFEDTGMTSDWLSVLQQYESTYRMPKPGDRVVALYLPVLDGDGFILGGL